MTQVLGFWPKSDDLSSQIFKPKNGMLSKLKMLPTTAYSSKTTDELDGDSCKARLFRPPCAVGASLRG